MNRLSSNACPMTAVSAERDDDRDDRHQHRDRGADERADDEQQHDQRGRQPELQLALVCRSLSESSVKSRSSVYSPVMCAANPPLPSAPLHDGDEVRDPLVLRMGEDDGQQRRVPVGRDQDLAARVQVAGDLRDAAVATRPPSARLAHACGERRIGDDEALGPHDDHLVDRVLVRQPRVDQLLRRVGLGVVGQLRVRRQTRSPAASRSGPTTRRTTTPHAASTRPGLRRGELRKPPRPEPGPRPIGSGLRDGERFGEEIDIPGSLNAA